MRKENFLGTDVIIGPLLDDCADGQMNNFILPNGEDNLEYSTFISESLNKHILYDIGCADGIFSLGFCRNNTKMSHAFDGAYKLQLSITQSILLNKNKKIYYHHMFVGNETKIIQYNTDGLQAMVGTGNNKDQILMIKMDDFWNFSGDSPDIIKIDVEGFEHNVLMGGISCILQCKPIIFLEIHPNFLKIYNNTYNDILKFQTKINYNVYDLNMNPFNYNKCNQPNIDSIRTIWKPKL